jgi:hypothetical protein
MGCRDTVTHITRFNDSESTDSEKKLITMQRFLTSCKLLPFITGIRNVKALLSYAKFTIAKCNLFSHAYFKRPNHGGITITSGVEEMPLPNSRRPSHGGITITSGFW